MHDIEPFYRWRDEYAVEEDADSPFFEATYSEPRQVYNFILHPLWDDFESNTLFLKILYTVYDEGFYHHRIYWRMERYNWQRYSDFEAQCLGIDAR